MSRHTHTHTLVLAGLAALATLGLSACGSTDGSAHAVAPAASTATATTAPGTPSATPSATPAPVPAPPAGSASGGTGPVRSGGTGGSNTGGGSGGGIGGGGGGGSSSGGSGGGGNNSGGGGGGTSAPAPKITSFKVKQQPTCPVHGTPDAPFSSPGSDVVIAWTVTGANGAAIAVDNPGTYGAYGSDYPASGELSLPFGCNDGTTTTHTYTVWPAGAHSTSKTLSVSAHSDN